MNISNGRAGAGACVVVVVAAATELEGVRESLAVLQCCIIVAIIDSDVVDATAAISVNVVGADAFGFVDKVTFACAIVRSVEVVEDADGDVVLLEMLLFL